MRRTALTIVAGLAYALAAAETPAMADILPLKGSLSFVDADGRDVRTSDFPGKWLLVHFGYTHCADLCPTSLSVLVNALNQIGPAAEHFQPLFVTVDPERDKGPILKTFADAFDKRLIGLGGTVEQIKEAAAALGISFQKVRQSDDGYSIDHSAVYILIGPDRKAAETFRLTEPHQLAAKLIGTLSRAGVPLGNVNNLRAYR
jgi:cytochrome oxidase Cu insertion factor (SCO1/SenC/PrrC family)